MNQDKILKTKQCIACKADIHAGATICSTCQSYQSDWKNKLKYFSSILGIASVVGALFVYWVSNINEIRKALFWNDEISVISFISFDHITVSNIGDGPVFLSHINFLSNLEKASFSNLGDLGVTLEPGKVQLISLPAQFKPEDFKSHYITVGGVDDEKWSEVLSKALSGQNSCYVFNVFSSDDPGLINMQNFYSKGSKNPLRTFKAKASVTFFSLKKNKKIIYSFPAIGTVAIDTRSAGCESE